MDPLSSISFFSRHPEARQGPGASAPPFPPFFINGSPSAHPAPPDSRSPPPAGDAPAPPAHEPLAEACSLASGPAWTASESRVIELLALSPRIGLAAQVWRDARGVPLQALPALACAAVRGADPEGWALGLARWGASFDTRLARSAARAELVSMAAPLRGRLLAVNARLDALSLWILACAEADHPHSAIRAIESVRERHPLLLGPLASELARFSDPRHWDKPGVAPSARAGAFVEAGWASDAFFSALLPSWALGPRGADIALVRPSVAGALSPSEARHLIAALEARPADAPGAHALLQGARHLLARGAPPPG